MVSTTNMRPHVTKNIKYSSSLVDPQYLVYVSLRLIAHFHTSLISNSVNFWIHTYLEIILKQWCLLAFILFISSEAMCWISSWISRCLSYWIVDINYPIACLDIHLTELFCLLDICVIILPRFILRIS